MSVNNAKLVVILGGTIGREFILTKQTNNIGRWDPNLDSHPEVDLSDEDISAKVSRIHSRIVKESEGFYLEDMESKNGTFLNNEFQLTPGNRYSIKNEDEIMIGDIKFKFVF